jgi:hypothetical protein
MSCVTSFAIFCRLWRKEEAVLFITNGDSAAGRIAASGLAGEILPWRDVLHEGPVPAGLPPEELADLRARFLAERGWANLAEARQDFARRDAMLARYGDHEEVVLFFEHDLYDQLQFIQVLDWFSGRDLGDMRLSIVHTDEYLGTLGPERLLALFHDRRETTEEQLALGSTAWEAFRSPDPTAVLGVIQAGARSLPFLASALRRHLEQFPSTVNGLSRSEEQALEAISGGSNTPGEAFAAIQEREEAVFLSDAVFVSHLNDLSAAREPLVLFEGVGPSTGVSRDDPVREDLWNQEVLLTEKGREVLRGDEDRVRLNGIDRWLGGVHLADETLWRWDRSTQTLKRDAA